MNEFLKYIAIIKNLIDHDYGKERVFYNNGEWYDRENCRNISLDELEKTAMSIVQNLNEQYEEKHKLTEKIYELMGEEEAEKFFDSME